MTIIGASLIIICICLVVWGIRLVRSSHQDDASARRTELLDEAIQLSPHLDLAGAVDALYVQRIRAIKQALAEGNDTDDLEDDMVILMNERLSLLGEQIDKECDFRVEQFINP